MSRLLIIADNSDGSALIFPTTPKPISVVHPITKATVTEDNYGDISWPIGRGPTVVSFKGKFYGSSRASALWVKPYWRPPADLVWQLEQWQVAQYHERRLLNLSLSESTLNLTGYLSEFSHELDGAFGDITYSLAFEEKRPTLVGIDAPAASTGAGTAAAGTVPGEAQAAASDTPATPASHTVLPGEYLILIAKLELGDSSRWQEIYAMNTAVIGPDPDLLQPGMVLQLPAGGTPGQPPATQQVPTRNTQQPRSVDTSSRYRTPKGGGGGAGDVGFTP